MIRRFVPVYLITGFIESGKTTNMQTETLCKIAKALDVSLDEIFFTESV